MRPGVIMPLIVPDVAEVDALIKILTPAMTIRLYSNNYVPTGVSLTANFTEVAGGGYTNFPMTPAGWVIIAGTPSVASHTMITWTFTGVTNAPGTIYGYYLTRNSDNLLMWAERFAPGVVPIVPVAGSIIQVTPVFTGGSVY